MILDYLSQRAHGASAAHAVLNVRPKVSGSS
jgi:hypothetical protein